MIELNKIELNKKLVDDLIYKSVRMIAKGKDKEIDELKKALKDKDNKIKGLKDKIKEDINKFSNNKNEVFMTQSSQIDASLISYCNELLDILEE